MLHLRHRSQHDRKCHHGDTEVAEHLAIAHNLSTIYIPQTFYSINKRLNQLEDGLRMPQHQRGCLYHLKALRDLDLQNLIRSSVGASEYSLSVLSKLLKLFMKYRSNNISPDKRDN